MGSRWPQAAARNSRATWRRPSLPVGHGRSRDGVLARTAPVDRGRQPVQVDESLGEPLRAGPQDGGRVLLGAADRVVLGVVERPRAAAEHPHFVAAGVTGVVVAVVEPADVAPDRVDVAGSDRVGRVGPVLGGGRSRVAEPHRGRGGGTAVAVETIAIVGTSWVDAGRSARVSSGKSRRHSASLTRITAAPVAMACRTAGLAHAVVRAITSANSGAVWTTGSEAE